MAEPDAFGDDLSVDVVWSAEAASAYARITAAAQAGVIGQGERKWSSAAVAVAAVMAGAGAFAMTSSALWATLATVLGAAAVFAGQWAYHFDMRGMRGAERLFIGDPEAYPPRKVVLNRTHLSEISNGISWQVALTRIKRVSRAEGLLMIWISRTDALAIPERCFATPEAANAFAETLAARMKAGSAAKD